MGTLTVTSTAGTAAGSTKIAVSGYGIGQNGEPDEGLIMKYCPNNASDSISFTYNTAPASGTWTEVAAAPFALTSQTANYYIYVVLINKQTGGVVAAGKTQNVVGA